MATSYLISGTRRAMAEPQDTLDNEAQLLLRATHDPALFAPIYERYVDRVYNYCLRRTGHAQDAEDLCSRVFARALESVHGYRGGSVPAWLFAIAHSVVAQHYRSRQNREINDTEFDETAAEAPDSSHAMDNAERRALLDRLFAELTDAQRHLLALSLATDLTSEQIGESLNRSGVSVRVEIHRLLKKLRLRARSTGMWETESEHDDVES